MAAVDTQLGSPSYPKPAILRLKRPTMAGEICVADAETLARLTSTASTRGRRGARIIKWTISAFQIENGKIEAAFDAVPLR
jgi:hypothetical protein